MFVRSAILVAAATLAGNGTAAAACLGSRPGVPCQCPSAMRISDVSPADREELLLQIRGIEEMVAERAKDREPSSSGSELAVMAGVLVSLLLVFGARPRSADPV